MSISPDQATKNRPPVPMTVRCLSAAVAIGMIAIEWQEPSTHSALWRAVIHWLVVLWAVGQCFYIAATGFWLGASREKTP